MVRLMFPLATVLLLLGCPTRSVNEIDDVDDDGDGFSEEDGDCDDTNAAVHPDAEEIVDNDLDDDCNGTELITLPGDDDDAADDDDVADDDDAVQDDDDGTPAPLEGDDAGECEDGADNDVDGLYDCDDPDCAGAPACEEALNTPPTAPVVSIVPAAAHSTHSLTCIIETPSADADGHAVTYTWAWALDSVDQGIGDVTVPASTTSTGDTWTCTVTANDGFVDGPPASATVTVTNEPPSAPVVTILPMVPITTDDLTCIIVTPGVDPEGLAVTHSYAWEVDGIPSTVTGPNVPETETFGDEVWTCLVTASDGGDDGPAGTAAVSIDIPPACVDGDPILGVTAWGRDDIAYCENVVAALSISRCAEGWHICDEVEFTSRNDQFVHTLLTFQASGGPLGCGVINSVNPDAHWSASSDLVDDDHVGTCPGQQGNAVVEDVGRRGDSLGSTWCAANSCGSLCCTD